MVCLRSGDDRWAGVTGPGKRPSEGETLWIATQPGNGDEQGARPASRAVPRRTSLSGPPRIHRALRVTGASASIDPVGLPRRERRDVAQRVLEHATPVRASRLGRSRAWSHARAWSIAPLAAGNSPRDHEKPRLGAQVVQR